MITLISYYALETNFIEDSGYTLQFWSTGSMIFGMVVIVSNLRVLIISSDHSIASIVSVIGSLVAYILCFLIASNIMFETATLYNELIPLFHSPNFHFGNILIIGFTSMFDLFEEWHKRWKDNA